MLRASVAAVVAVAGVLVGAPRLGGDGPPSLTLMLAGRAVTVAPGTTLAEAAARFGLRPRSGELLDVHGKVLRADAFPGRLLVDGRPASGAEILRAGDRVVAVGGRNRTEPLTHRLLHVLGGESSDPQFTLSRTPGVQVVVSGADSHELVSARFRATGSAQTQRAVALTFDDGPSPQYTPRILATLTRLHVHATFFVIGYLAQAYPQLVRRELRLGMTVGNHSYNHPEVPPFDKLPKPLMRDEILLAAQILTRVGAPPKLFRPPGGGNSTTLVRTAADLGERVVLWSVDPTDWSPGTTAKQIAARVLSAVRPGSIVDLHDGGGDRSATLAALPAIVRGIRARGLSLVALTPEPATTLDATGAGGR